MCDSPLRDFASRGPSRVDLVVVVVVDVDGDGDVEVDATFDGIRIITGALRGGMQLSGSGVGARAAGRARARAERTSVGGWRAAAAMTGGARTHAFGRALVTARDAPWPLRTTPPRSPRPGVHQGKILVTSESSIVMRRPEGHELCTGHERRCTRRWSAELERCASTDGTNGRLIASAHWGIGASGHRGIGASGHRGIGASGHRGIGASGHRGIGASHRIASHRIASHRIASHRIASHRIASHRIGTSGVAHR